MGVEPFITGAAVSAVLAQRLARKLCVHCKEPYDPTSEEIAALRIGDERKGILEGATFHKRKGCARCGQTGYRGRVGVFQLLEMSERLEQLASERASREEIEREARAEGMRSMWDDGLGKAAAGITSVEELARVCTV
jgi:type II secretory ATPase GspE/PulE/Tfp pilus assembly ATPase PilB-like protein